jgi:polysaccharide biosynthesis protein PslH
MKVLYFTVRPPYPPYKGDQLIAYEQIKRLKEKKVKVYLVCFIDDKKDGEVVKEKLNKYCDQIITIQINKFVKFINLFKTLINFKPLQVNLFTNRYLLSLVRKICEEINPDVIHVQTVRLAEYFMNYTKPKVIDMIDALSLNMARRAKKENILLKIVLNLESLLLKNYESKVLNSYQQTIIVSKNDKKYLNKDNIIVNPNGTFITNEYLERYRDVVKDEIIIFHGNMNYFPNVEAMLKFTKEVWPRIHEKYPTYKLYIVGKDPVKKIRELDGVNNIVVTGFVEEICEYLCKATIGVYPMYSGTGMQNKILEALACGLPIVATPLALQGIQDITEKELIKSTNNEELFYGIERLIKEKSLRERLSKNGQEFVFKNYSWDKNVDNLIKVWEKVKGNR